MDNVITDFLSNFSVKMLTEELRKRGNHTTTHLLSDIDDAELIDEIHVRDLEDHFEPDPYDMVSEGLDLASDEQIIDEYESRCLHYEEKDNRAEKIYNLIASGQPYDTEVRSFISELSGRIL